LAGAALSMGAIIFISLFEVDHKGLLLFFFAVVSFLMLIVSFIFPTWKLKFAGSSFHYFRLVIPRLVVVLLTFLPIEPESAINNFLIIVKRSLPASLVLNKIAFINIPVCPIVHPIAMLPIQHVMTLIIFLSSHPHSIPIPIALLEIPIVLRAICPRILSESFGQSVHKLSIVFISIGEVLDAFSMFQPILEMS
jgi:hypothetical protein